MKLRIRTLTNTEVEIDAESNSTIFDVKNSISKALPEMNAEAQVLIHQGIILSNEKTLSLYSQIKENDRLVVLVPQSSRNKVVSEDCAVSKLESEPIEVSTAESANNNECIVNNTEEQTEESSTPTKIVIESGESTFVFGPEFETTIQNMCSMGFERQHVEQALRQAYHNPHRAIELLLNNSVSVFNESQIENSNEDVLDMEEDEETKNLVDDYIGDVENTAENVNGAGDLLSTDDKSDEKQTKLLQYLYNVMTENPESILENTVQFLSNVRNDNFGTEALDQELTHDPSYAQISENRKHLKKIAEAIGRLENLGFSPVDAIQALLCCNMNEDYAANMLFENMTRADDNS